MKKKAARRILSLTAVFALVLGMMLTTRAADNGLTRAEMTKLLVEGIGMADQAGVYAGHKSAFTDVAEDSQYEGYINLAQAKGLVSGVGEGKFAPDAKTTQTEAATVLLKYYGVPAGLMKAWPADYESMARWSGLMDGLTFEGGKTLTAEMFQKMLANGPAVAKKPVIGISWKSSDQDYSAFKTVIQAAGGIPVEMPKVVSSAVQYDAEGKVAGAYLESSGNLKQQYADVIKSRDFSKSNVDKAMADIDGMFFTGGEDISPSLFAVPQPVENMGEEINAARDISDYILMAYCIEKDVPTFAVCRGEQMMSIVSGCTFIQDIPAYYAEKGVEYHDEHRMPPGTPNRDYERHDVEVFKDSSKWMYNIVGSTELKNVSSWHHQVVDSVEGTNLTVVAKTNTNGIDIIEAVERQDKTFCLGVQFHPENDCKTVLVDGKEAVCDFEVCMNFFRTLTKYAAK